MTREEAIEILEANRPDPCYQMLREAVDFAVDALKAQLQSAQPKQDREFMKLTFRNSDGRPYFSIIYLEFDDNGIGHDFEGYSSYSLDVISDYLKKYFMPSAQPKPCEDAVSRADAFNAINDYVNSVGVLDGYTDTQEVLRIVKRLPSAQPNLDRTKISDLLEKIYSIQSVHLSVEGVLARKYYCKQLWIELFGSEDIPAWID